MVYWSCYNCDALLCPLQEDWNEEVKATVVPLVINCHLRYGPVHCVAVQLEIIASMVYRGDLTEVKPWLGEAVYNKLSADIKAVRLLYVDIKLSADDPY